MFKHLYTKQSTEFNHHFQRLLSNGSVYPQFTHILIDPRYQPGPTCGCKHLVETQRLKRNKARCPTGFYYGPPAESLLSVFICALACSLRHARVLGQAADTLQAPCPFLCESRDSVWHQTWEVSLGSIKGKKVEAWPPRADKAAFSCVISLQP